MIMFPLCSSSCKKWELDLVECGALEDKIVDGVEWRSSVTMPNRNRWEKGFDNDDK